MEKPNTCVAVVSNLNGGCQYVGKVKTITKTEYATLLKEQREHELTEQKEKRELNELLTTLVEEIKTLKQENKVLKGEDTNEESIED